MGCNQLAHNNYLPTWNASCETWDCWDSQCRDRSRQSCIRVLRPCRPVWPGSCICCCPHPPASLPRPQSSCPVLISRYCSVVSATPRPPDEIYFGTETPKWVSASRWSNSLGPAASPSCWHWWPAMNRMMIALLTIVLKILLLLLYDGQSNVFRTFPSKSN